MIIYNVSFLSLGNKKTWQNYDHRYHYDFNHHHHRWLCHDDDGDDDNDHHHHHHHHHHHNCHHHHGSCEKLSGG